MKLIKKPSLYIPLTSFLRVSLSLALVLGCTHGVECSILPEETPYNYIPEGRPIDTEEYHKPQNMIDIVPNRPVVAHDKNGNTLYFSPSGNLSLSISQDGKQEFTLRSAVIDRDSTGKITSTTELINNTGKSVRKNEKGEIVGYVQTAFGGKASQEFDAQGNLTKTYQYNCYGKTTQFIVDEMTQTKTVFDSKGLMVCDTNFEGYQIAWYRYDDKSRLASKVDGYGNVTSFNKDGSMNQTVDYSGRLMSKYNYKKDDEGRNILDYVEDVNTGEKTFYTNGAQVTKNREGTIVKDYSYDGSKLVYTFDRVKNETTWYDINGKQLYTTFNDVMVNQWLYYKGKEVGAWDQSDNTITIFQSGREAVKIKNPGVQPPTADQIQKWVDDGLIQDAQSTYSDYLNSKPWEKKPDISGDLTPSNNTNN